jgi:hypothetical protein
LAEVVVEEEVVGLAHGLFLMAVEAAARRVARSFEL